MILLLIILVATPILILQKIKNQKYKFLWYILITTIITALIMILFAWWTDKSNLILLKYYGYNIDGINEDEFYGNVSKNNIESVRELVRSMMGIGWPLKAIFGFIYFYTYLIIVYIISIILKRIKQK